MKISDISLTAHNLPLKLLRSTAIDKSGFISPYHVTIYPTNACNLVCEFCNCSSRDSSQHLSLDDCIKSIKMFHTLGTKAITLSGGGDPLMHPNINEIVSLIHQLGMKCGIITNGFRLTNLTNYDGISWIRISLNPRTDIIKLFQVVDRLPREKFRLGFRYILHDEPRNLAGIIDYVHNHPNLYLYITGNIYDKASLSKWDLSEYLSDRVFVEDKANNILNEIHDCYIGLLKPHLAADGYIYPCCLIGFDKEMMRPQHRLCHYSEYPEYAKKQMKYDGSGCVYCFYQHYNKHIQTLRTELLDADFI